MKKIVILFMLSMMSYGETAIDKSIFTDFQESLEGNTTFQQEFDKLDNKDQILFFRMLTFDKKELMKLPLEKRKVYLKNLYFLQSKFFKNLGEYKIPSKKVWKETILLPKDSNLLTIDEAFPVNQSKKVWKETSIFLEDSNQYYNHVQVISNPLTIDEIFPVKQFIEKYQDVIDCNSSIENNCTKNKSN